MGDRFDAAGKALQFNGISGDYAVIPRPNWMDWTISFWVKTTATGGTGQWWNGEGLVDGEVAGVVDDFGTSLVGSKAAFGVGNPDTTITSTTAINDGRWHHLAAERSAFTPPASSLSEVRETRLSATPSAAPRFPGICREIQASGGFQRAITPRNLN